jgi:hypothetical protein
VCSIQEKITYVSGFFKGLRNFDPVKLFLVEIFGNRVNKYDVGFSAAM